MKISRIVLAVLFALAASANTLRAAPLLPTFSFHENGNGKLELPLSLAAASSLTWHAHIRPRTGRAVECSDFYGTPSGGPLSGGRCGAARREWPRFRHPAVRYGHNRAYGLTQLIFFYSNDHAGCWLIPAFLRSVCQHGHHSGKPVRSNHLYPNCRPARLRPPMSPLGD